MSRVVLAACAVLLLLAEAHAQSDWKKEWEKTIEAAKKEGQVNVYIGGWEAVVESGAFQKAYPEIKVTWVGGRAGEAAKRILAERRAGKFIADVSSEGITSNYRSLHAAKSLDPIKPALLLPEVTNESLWYQGRHRYIDPEGQFVFRYVGTQQKGNVSYNSKLVNPKEIHSVWDLVDARWKGKIIARDVRSPGPGNAPMRFFYHHPAIGPTFIKKLFGEMDVTLFRDFRQSIDWLASGKASLCFFCADTDKAKLQGLPVEEFANFKEGAALVTQYGHARALEPRAPCECGEGFHQLVSLARRPDRAAKIFSPELRRDGRFTAHRYSERRRKAGEPPRRWSQLSRRRRRDRMDGDEAGAGNFRRGARECGKTKKVIEPMIESSCASAGIGFLNDLFYGRSYSAGSGELSILVCA